MSILNIRFLDKCSKPKIQIVLSGFILLLTILTSVADSKITDYTNDVMMNQGKLNNLLLISLNASANNIKFSQLYLGNFIDQVSLEYPVSDNPKNKVLWESLQNKSLSANEYIKEISNLYNSEYIETIEEYNTFASSTATPHFFNGTSWHYWKNLFIILQVFLILISITIVYIKPQSIKLSTNHQDEKILGSELSSVQ